MPNQLSTKPLTQEEKSGILAKVATASIAAERRTGCPAEMSAAQCILESKWLRSAPGNNCFGIKDTDRYPGAQYKITKEFIDGTWRVQTLAFEIYPTLTDCFIDHARLITGGFNPAKPNLYAPAWAAYQRDHDLESWITAVSAHYATDPRYAQKVLGLARDANILAALVVAAQFPLPEV